MASLLYDQESEHYFIRFRYGGRSFKRSFDTGNEKLSRAQAGRIEETLLLLRNGPLAIPPTVDPVAFILSDGRRTQTHDAALMTLAELMAAYQAGRVPGHKEASTIKTENIHIRHLLPIMKGKLGCATIIRDLDGKYSAEFDRAFTDRSIKIKPIRPRAPNLNAFVERWIQSLKHEALNHFIVFGLEHFDHIVREFVVYYHQCRPHQGIGNRLIGLKGGDEPPQDVSLEQVRCEKRHGGLLKHYYCAA